MKWQPPPEPEDMEVDDDSASKPPAMASVFICFISPTLSFFSILLLLKGTALCYCFEKKSLCLRQQE